MNQKDLTNSTPSNKQRNSLIELVRIISMFMVLMLHVNFAAIGEPTQVEAIHQPLQTFVRVFFQMFANISVDLFVLISGWFSIRASAKSLTKLLYQCIFILALMYAIGLGMGKTVLSVNGILDCLFMRDNAWFITSYIGLFLLSPVLNSFVEHSTERQLRLLLMTFYAFQTIYGSLYISAGFISFGYSCFSFIGLYLLARYFRLYGERLMKYGSVVWATSLFIAVVMFFVSLYFGYLPISYTVLHYTSLTTVAGALGALLWIASLPAKYNKIINFIAASCFAVYLIHICLPWTTSTFLNMASEIYHRFSGVQYFATILLFMGAVFVAGIILDQPRKYSWEVLSRLIFKER